MTDHAHELRRYAYKVGRPAGDTPAVMHQAATYIEDLERKLREAEARVAELEAERAERAARNPVAAQAVGYVNALRYIAWEAAGYMDCVHAAKQAIGETGALPPPPKTQPTRGGD